MPSSSISTTTFISTNNLLYQYSSRDLYKTKREIVLNHCDHSNVCANVHQPTSQYVQMATQPYKNRSMVIFVELCLLRLDQGPILNLCVLSQIITMLPAVIGSGIPLKLSEKHINSLGKNSKRYLQVLGVLFVQFNAPLGPSININCSESAMRVAFNAKLKFEIGWNLGSLERCR